MEQVEQLKRNNNEIPSHWNCGGELDSTFMRIYRKSP